jgi:transcriptional regulator with XRE-family HTH domain
MSTIHDPRYEQLVAALVNARTERNITQVMLAERLGQHQSYVAKVEGLERRLDVIELFDWLQGLEYEPQSFFQDIGWFPRDGKVIPLPLRNRVRESQHGVFQQLVWEGQIKEVSLEGISAEQYLTVENYVVELFSALNLPNSRLKNREAIAQALEFAVDYLPDLNPSDIYQHIIYRFYLREYKRSTPEQSWVRAGGEALELFIERRYSSLLQGCGIRLRALISAKDKGQALREMGLTGKVGDSKLDVALYGYRNDEWIIFGGVHSKASLAERVSDDVPCSEAMMRSGLVSFLYTFDSKSFPPPAGDLVNRGELGSISQPSDKRRYIEEHGSFDACFSYNLRSAPSPEVTPSGKRIFVCSLKPEEDIFPSQVIDAWEKYKTNL